MKNITDAIDLSGRIAIVAVDFHRTPDFCHRLT